MATKSIQIIDTWIFSKKEDLLISSLIILLGIGLGHFIKVFQIFRVGLIEIALVAILFDLSHIFPTFIRTYLDSQEFAARKKLYILVPLFSLLVTTVSFLIGPKVAIAVYSAISLFHFIRQQFGWMNITLNKGPELTKVELWWNKLLFYNLVFTPIIMLLAEPSHSFRWLDTYPKIPVEFFPYIRLFFYSLLFFHGLYELYNIFIRKIFNPARYIQCLLAFATWFVFPYLVNNIEQAYVLLIISHGLSYWYISLVFIKKRWLKQKYKGHALFENYRGSIMIYLSIVLVTIFYWNLTGFNRSMGTIIYGNWMYGMGLPMTLSLTHYFLDGFIWRRKVSSVSETLYH